MIFIKHIMRSGQYVAILDYCDTLPGYCIVIKYKQDIIFQARYGCYKKAYVAFDNACQKHIPSAEAGKEEKDGTRAFDEDQPQPKDLGGGSK